MADFSWLPAGVDPARLPAGMRNSNPGNIKYFKGLNYPGLVGPSVNTDQGDPQMVFDSPQSGMNAASSLALRKYRGGMKTAASLVAGNKGWTPGNAAAAGNIARTMGVGPNDDLGLDDPKRLSTFLRALTLQEHGGASKLYGDPLYTSAAEAAMKGLPPGNPSQFQAAALRKQFGTSTEGGATKAAAVTPTTGTDRLKAAIAQYDPSLISAGQDMQKRGQSIAVSGDRTGAIGGTIVAGLGGLLEGYEGTAKKEHDTALGNALMNSGSAKDTISALMGSSDPEYRKAGVELLIKSQAAKTTQPIEVNGRLVMPQPDGTFKEVYAAPAKPEGLREVAPGSTVFDPNKNAAVFTAPAAASAPSEIEKRAIAAGLKPGSQEFNDYVLKGPRDQALTDYQRRQIDEADDYIVTGKAAIKNLKQAIDLSGKAYSGPAAGTRGYATSLFGSEGGEATENVHNLVGTQAVGQLKAIFGGNPTEGERGILLELQGSVNQAPKVREEIWGRALDLIESRVKQRQAEADQIRSGSYYKPGGGLSSPTTAPQANPDMPLPVKTQTIDPATGQAATPSAPSQQAAPPPAIRKLMENPTPEMQQFFDQKYGTGTAARIIEEAKRPQVAPPPDPLALQPGSVGAF